MKKITKTMFFNGLQQSSKKREITVKNAQG
jgi:hypothetical protein